MNNKSILFLLGLFFISLTFIQTATAWSTNQFNNSLTTETINLSTSTSLNATRWIQTPNTINKQFLFAKMSVYSTDSGGIYCYQETANKSSAGDGSCGLSYTGKYFGEVRTALYDEDWGSNAWNYGTMYINYTAPTGATTDSQWRVSMGAGSGYYTLKDYNCAIINGVVQFSVTSWVGDYMYGPWHSDGACRKADGSWRTILSTDVSSYVYEDAMNWFIPSYQTVNISVGNTSIYNFNGTLNGFNITTDELSSIINSKTYSNDSNYYYVPIVFSSNKNATLIYNSLDFQTQSGLTFVNPTPANASSMSILKINTSTDIPNFKNVTFNIYDRFGRTINSTTFNDHPYAFLSYPQLPKELYYFNATACDTNNNCSYSTEIRKVSVIDGYYDIVECGLINQSGNYYLWANLSNSAGDCIDINSSDVNFDGQGYMIQANGSNAFHIGVTQSIVFNNITIKNLIIDNASTGIYEEHYGFVSGSWLAWRSSLNTTISNVTMRNVRSGTDLCGGVDTIENSYITTNYESTNWQTSYALYASGWCSSGGGSNIVIVRNNTLKGSVTALGLDNVPLSYVSNNFINGTWGAMKWGSGTFGGCGSGGTSYFDDNKIYSNNTLDSGCASASGGWYLSNNTIRVYGSPIALSASYGWGSSLVFLNSTNSIIPNTVSTGAGFGFFDRRGFVYTYNISMNVTTDSWMEWRNYWFFRTKLKDSQNNSISGVNITITDGFGNITNSILTNDSGYSDRLTLIESVWLNATNITYYSPLNVTFVKEGYESKSLVYNTTDLKEVDIDITLKSYTPKVSITYPSENETIETKYIPLTISTTSDFTLDKCFYNMTRNGVISKANTLIPDCKSTTATIDDDGNYTIYVYINNTKGYSNSTSLSFGTDLRGKPSILSPFNWQVTMLTSENVYNTWTVKNIGAKELRNCVVSIGSLDPYATFSSNNFNLLENEMKDIVVTINRPAEGSYRTNFSMACDISFYLRETTPSPPELIFNVVTGYSGTGGGTGSGTPAGGSVGIEDQKPKECNINLVRPTKKIVLSGSTGEVSNKIDFVVENSGALKDTFNFVLSKELKDNCKIKTDRADINGKSSFTNWIQCNFVSQSYDGLIEITSSAKQCDSSLSVEVSSSFLGKTISWFNALLNGQDILVFGVLVPSIVLFFGLILLMILITGLALLIKKVISW